MRCPQPRNRAKESASSRLTGIFRGMGNKPIYRGGLKFISSEEKQ
jgi:hypothetical protein